MLTTLACTFARKSRTAWRSGLPLLPSRDGQEGRPVDRVDVPPRAAGRLGIGIEHANARLRQVGPVLDPLGIARPMADDHQAVGDHPPVRPVVPRRLDPARLDQQLHVALVREDRDVGVEPRRDRPRLRPRAVVRLLEPDRPARLLPSTRPRTPAASHREAPRERPNRPRSRARRRSDHAPAPQPEATTPSNTRPTQSPKFTRTHIPFSPRSTCLHVIPPSSDVRSRRQNNRKPHSSDRSRTN